MLYDSDGIDQNFSLAKEQFKLAADQKNAKGIVGLGKYWCRVCVISFSIL